MDTPQIPEVLSLLPLKDVVIFPQMILPVFISEEICLQAVEEASKKHKMLFLSAFVAKQHEKTNDIELRASTPPPFDVYDVGTVAQVMKMRRLPDGRTKVLIQGLERAVLRKLTQREPFPLVEVRPWESVMSSEEASSEIEATIRAIKGLLSKVVSLGKSFSPDLLVVVDDVVDPGKLADLIASNLGLKVHDSQKVLVLADPIQRLALVHSFLARELEVHTMQVKIQTHAKDEMFKNQREHFLREQMKAIKNELGELDGKDEMEDLMGRIEASGMSLEASQECKKQLKRLERMHPESSEASITRTYLDWMLDLPWKKPESAQLDLQYCKKVLDDDHFGLDKVKDRILEYIAVQKLNPSAKAPILCFVGPPGVGKTSLGRSIATALSKEFVRISLGGVRDESEIRGHRRTYVGALPGRIIQALKTAGTVNPIVMLDEIDKLGADYKGDPASALLEVLDPEQNKNFSDHYISVPYDLSRVTFISNANRLDTIPAPLRDRLEIIEIGGYSEEEKFEIAKQYIIPKTIEQSGLSAEVIQFHDAAILTIINGYTREAGLRNLEKLVATICRKIARMVAENDERGRERRVVKVTAKLARELLGEERFLADDHEVDIPRVGVSTGLAYTTGGGEVLEIEVNLSSGKGGLLITGQLGDVMRESAQTALSYVRSCAERYGIESQKFTHSDVHVHVPAGAIPKDGPSAGVALTVALLSAFTGIPVRQDYAMTGEITLHGRILPVGGLREKILAAARVGIKVVCLPEKNRGLVSELPISVRKKVEIKFVKAISEITDEVLIRGALTHVTKEQNVQMAG